MTKLRRSLSFLLLPFFCSVVLAKESTISNEIRAVYYGNSIGVPGAVRGAIELVRRTELNAVVVNTKNDDGALLLGKTGRDSIAALKIQGISVICRIVVMHDNRYAKSHPAAVLKSKSSNGKEFWHDGKGWVWIDPLDNDYQRYLLLDVILQSIGAGCDEINLDYILFPSPIDGKTTDIMFPLWKDTIGSRCNAIENLLFPIRSFLKKHFPSVTLSVDIFGYTFLGDSEERIGQCLHMFAKYVDVIAPMLYPSHFGCNDRHFKAVDPNTVPYTVYNMSMGEGLKRLRRVGVEPKIRPWLEAFDFRNICVDTEKGCVPGCGVVRMRYSERKNFRAQIEGFNDLRDPAIVGWMAWNPNYSYPYALFDPK